jgi:hypothetical protein
MTVYVPTASKVASIIAEQSAFEFEGSGSYPAFSEAVGIGPLHAIRVPPLHTRINDNQLYMYSLEYCTLKRSNVCSTTFRDTVVPLVNTHVNLN